MTGTILEEAKLESISKEVSGDPRIHCLIGHGTGNQFYSVADLRYLGIWTQDRYEVKNGFKDSNGILKSYTDAKYTQRQIDYLWSVTYYQTEEQKLLLRAGDFVTLKPLHENSEYLSCQSIENSLDGRIKLELGAKRPTFLDSKEVLQNSPHGYIDRYMRENHEPITMQMDFYPGDPAHAIAAGSNAVAIAVPDKVKNESDRPRITLSVSLSPKAGTDPDYGRIGMRIWVVDGYTPFGYLVGTIGKAFSDSIPEIDITDLVDENTNNTIALDVMMAEEFTTAHSAYTEHPAISASLTMNFYKRGDLTV